MKGLAALLAVVLAYAAFICVLEYAVSHTDKFTVGEQLAAANAVCQPHGGIDNFDDADDDGSG
ncbi:MAG TPA: hypothetical protein VLA89_11145, partial [Gemmatimonadales bacterium]|nr:hypothetical protein [Gemmatimonadales bacterium]